MALEEDDGYMEVVRECRPEFTSQVEALRTEHDDFRRRLRRATARLERLSTSDVEHCEQVSQELGCAVGKSRRPQPQGSRSAAEIAAARRRRGRNRGCRPKPVPSAEIVKLPVRLNRRTGQKSHPPWRGIAHATAPRRSRRHAPLCSRSSCTCGPKANTAIGGSGKPRNCADQLRQIDATRAQVDHHQTAPARPSDERPGRRRLAATASRQPAARPRP